jgi:hypothetical protein
MPPKNSRRLGPFKKLAIGGSAVIVLLLAGTIGAGVQAQGLKHFITCFGLMLTNPDQHREQCSPFNGTIDTPSIFGGTKSLPEVVPTTTVTVFPTLS